MKKKMILYIMTEGGPVSKIFGPSHQVKVVQAIPKERR